MNKDITILSGCRKVEIYMYICRELKTMFINGTFDARFLCCIYDVEHTWMKLYPDEEMIVDRSRYDAEGYRITVRLKNSVFNVN